ncbi:MAG: hypothetical protein KA312_09290 [Sphingorhabdus sp.]|nr:hypothetical protein [Sphingorhabdus sp.]
MTGKYLLPAILATAMLTSSCAGQSVPRSAIAPSANPSAIIAAEIAFNRLAQEKGQWTAFRETSAKDAVMFVPEVVLVQEWLKGRTDPAKSVTWQPHKAFMSCDGKTGVTTGAWQRPDGSVGYFTTVWQWLEKGKRPKKAPPSYIGKGEWKWVVDHGDALTAPRAAPEMIETRVASCKGQPNAPLSAPPEGAKMKMGLSRDQSFNFTWVVMPNGARSVVVRLWNGQDFDTVIADKVAAPKP